MCKLHVPSSYFPPVLPDDIRVRIYYLGERFNRPSHSPKNVRHSKTDNLSKRRQSAPLFAAVPVIAIAETDDSSRNIANERVSDAPNTSINSVLFLREEEEAEAR